MNDTPKKRAAATPRTHTDLGAKLILFEGLKKNNALAPLNGKLLLTSEDLTDTGYVFGYVLNNSLQQRMRSFLKKSGVSSVPESEQFRQIFNGAADGLGAFYDDECIIFLTRNGQTMGTSNETSFGGFNAYICESAEEATLMLDRFEGRETIVISNYCMIDRQKILKALETGKARMRDADPDIVFNKSAYMRTVLAFPPEPDAP